MVTIKVQEEGIRELPLGQGRTVRKEGRKDQGAPAPYPLAMPLER